MKTLRNLPVPQDGDNINFPDGQIRNETTTELGTPVVREIYGDVLTNIYKILRDSGINPTETEDGEGSQYQLLDALKVFFNKLNDIQQTLTVNAADIAINVNFDHLPINYIFIGKVTEEILATENYTLNGTGGLSYPLTSDVNIPASSIVLLTLNAAGSKLVNISSSVIETWLNTSFGTPLAFNESNKLLYYSNGIILTDFPASFLIENKIQVFSGSLNIKIVDVVLLKGKLICFTFDTVLLKYQAFSFNEDNLDVVVGEIAIPDLSGSDNQPYMYCDNEYLYFTNTQTVINESVNNYDIGKFSFDEIALTVVSVSFTALDANFSKTTNVFIDKASNKLYTFINGYLYNYDLAGAARVLMGFFNTINGVVFKFNGETYYSNGNSATKWNY